MKQAENAFHRSDRATGERLLTSLTNNRNDPARLLAAQMSIQGVLGKPDYEKATKYLIDVTKTQSLVPLAENADKAEDGEIAYLMNTQFSKEMKVKTEKDRDVPSVMTLMGALTADPRFQAIGRAMRNTRTRTIHCLDALCM